MFLMMCKCDCCILSFTSANTDNDHCDDVLMYDDGDDPSMISHPCTMYHRSWSTDDWHTADDEPKSHHHCSGRPPPLLVPILHHLPWHTYTQCTHCFHRIFMSSTLLGNISPFQSFLKICAAASFISIILDFCSSTQKLTFFYNFAARFNIKNLNFNLITL